MSAPNLPAIVAHPEPDRSEPSPRARAIRRSIDAGNVRAGRSQRVKHGIYSLAATREAVRDEAALLVARLPWVDEVRDGVLIEATARVIVRLRLIDAELDRTPTRDMLTLGARLEGQLLRNLAELGATPRSAASLGLARMTAAEQVRKAAERDLRRYRPKSPKRSTDA